MTCSSTLIPSSTWTHVGGKFICLRFVGMAVLMPQCGNFVPAGLEIMIVRWMESPHSCLRWWRRPTVYCPQPQPPPSSPPTARSWLGWPSGDWWVEFFILLIDFLMNLFSVINFRIYCFWIDVARIANFLKMLFWMRSRGMPNFQRLTWSWRRTSLVNKGRKLWLKEETLLMITLKRSNSWKILVKIRNNGSFRQLRWGFLHLALVNRISSVNRLKIIPSSQSFL